MGKDNIPKYIVVFDMDETLGHFEQLSIFWMTLVNYLNKKSIKIKKELLFQIIDNHFNKILRPKIIDILKYLQLQKKNNISSTYWIEWLLQFESLCRQKKINLVCETRQNMPVKFEFQKDSIWLIWETLLAELDDRKDDKKILRRIINSLLNLYCIKFSNSAKKKRKSIIYFAVSLLTDFVDFNIEIFSQSSFIENVVKKIDTIYKELKKNEKSPETDYLFTNVKKDNFDKSISKIEMMNNLEDFDKE